MDYELSTISETITPLASVFGFSADDLRANRERRLSFRQRRQLWGRFITTALGGLFLMIIPPVLVWFVIVWSTGQTLNETLGDQRAVFGYGIAALLGLMYCIANIKGLLLLVDLVGNRVRMIRGGANIWGSYLIMGHYRFVVDDDAAAFVQSGMRYRAYVLPASSTLLSIEFAD